ncbi:MAG: coenzyme F420-0:L-glutamate ligase [Pseudomonadota bacterium]|nr:coenzyme F420-0:L-glutamate ligase [Pseudomonadota bacterium]
MSSSTRRVNIIALSQIPEICTGDNIARITVAAAEDCGETLEDGDVIVIAQKIVSKAEDRCVSLDTTIPSDTAKELSEETGKDARLIHHILLESSEIPRKREGLIIARHKSGCVVANAGIDLSNAGGNDTAILLPLDADASAKKIAMEFLLIAGKSVAVVVNDSMGRAWRMGTTGTAIGSFGLAALQDRRGHADRDGVVLQSSEIAIADEVAAAASLLMGQGNEGLPVVIVRGLDWANGSGCAADLVRPLEQDLFR